MYNYREALYDDIVNYIIMEDITDFSEEAYETLYDELWCEDAVTGNGSGWYTDDFEQAREYLRGNEELYWEMHCEFDHPLADFFTEPRVADVCIRCYLLGEVLWTVFEEFRKREDEENEDS